MDERERRIENEKELVRMEGTTDRLNRRVKDRLREGKGRRINDEMKRGMKGERRKRVEE